MSVRLSLGYDEFNRLYDACEGLCGICRKQVGGLTHKKLSADHVVPRKRGGFDGLGNLFIAHKSCNERKGGRWPTGCECITLMVVNARLGVPDCPVARAA